MFSVDTCLSQGGHFTAPEGKNLRGDQSFFQARSDDNQIKNIGLNVSHAVMRLSSD